MTVISDRSESSSGQRTTFLWPAAAAFVICFAPVMAAMVGLWSTYALYSYGFAVPLIAGYLFWLKRGRTPPIITTPDYALGIPTIAAGLASLLVGRIGALVTLELTSLLLTLA